VVVVCAAGTVVFVEVDGVAVAAVATGEVTVVDARLVLPADCTFPPPHDVTATASANPPAIARMTFAPVRRPSATRSVCTSWVQL
jgi:hypothetical protein